LVRASNTGPELIVRCEGRSPEALEQIKAELFGCLQSLGMEEKGNPAGFPFTPVYNYPESGFQDQV
ncbi:MAG: phosphomannomutase, partial [Syntrophomonas sp.]|nr:phosphomannomutase [Syntrophomonas sp.]